LQHGQTDYTRRTWARHAVNALSRAGESKIAASLQMKLGNVRRALKLLLDAGDTEGAAKCCLQVSAHLRAQGKEQVAMTWSGEAFKQYKKIKQDKRCLELLESTPGLYEYLKSLPASNAAEEVARRLLASGDKAVALTASKYVNDSQVGKARIYDAIGSAAAGKAGIVAAAGAEKSDGGSGGANAGGAFDDLILVDLDEDDGADDEYGDFDDFIVIGRGRKGRGKSRHSLGKTPGSAGKASDR
jgi:hypothetical protein